MTWITPIKSPHLDGSLGSFTMPATFTMPAGCLKASEKLTRWAAKYGTIADSMFSSKCSRGAHLCPTVAEPTRQLPCITHTWRQSCWSGNHLPPPIQKPRVSSAISFLVPKKTGDLCPVIDLSHLNDHLVIPQFKMETQASVRLSIKESKWIVSIDI